MQLFSDEYLMHWGVKGMKWKKHRKDRFFTDNPEERKEFETANQYLQEGYYKVQKDPLSKGMDDASKRSLAYKHANDLHRSDVSVSKHNAYKRNQKRLAKQQNKAKLNRILGELKTTGRFHYNQPRRKKLYGGGRIVVAKGSGGRR